MRFDRLKKEVRRWLSRGLEHLAVQIRSPGPGHSVAQGREWVQNQSGRERISSRMIQPGEIASGDSLALPPNARAQSEWAEVFRRWQTLSIDLRRGLIDINQLTFLQKAQLIFSRIIDERQLYVRRNLPKRIKRLFSNFSWSLDGSMFEMRHRETVIISSPIEYLEQVNRLAHLAGVDSHLNAPLHTLMNDRLYDMAPAYHFHLSFPEQDLTERAEYFNLIQLFEGAKDGVNVLSGMLVSYRDTNRKGLITLVDPHRIEFRMQNRNPLQALLRALRIVSSPDAAYGELMSLLVPEQSVHFEGTAAQRKSRVEDAMAIALENANPLVRGASIEGLRNSGPRFQPIIARRLSDPDVSVRRLAIYSLRSSEDRQVRQAITQLMTDPDASVRGIARFVMSEPERQRLRESRFLTSTSEIERREAISVLSQSENSDFVPAVYSAIQQLRASALRNQATWSAQPCQAEVLQVLRRIAR